MAEEGKTLPTLRLESRSDESKFEDDYALIGADEKAVVRRIDLHLLPLMTITYMLQYFDKTTLGYTAILGIQKDTNLHGTDYSWVSSAFYFGYLVASYPASIGFVKFPLAKFLSVCMQVYLSCLMTRANFLSLLWAIVLACHGAANSFASLMVLRIFLGVFESTISPGMSLMTSLWYKPSEHALRHGIWFAGNGCAALFGGLLAYAISHIQNGVTSWRWLFIIFGIITFAWGIVLVLFLPDSPTTARFLNSQQKDYAHRRPQQHTHSFKTTKWKKEQFFEALRDPITWLLFLYTVCSTIPNGGLTNFSTIIIQGLGFDTFDTLLMGMPTAAFQLLWVILASVAAAKLRRARCLIIACLQLISLAGSVMVYAIPTSHKWGRLAGIWLFPAFAAGLPLSLSLIASNVAGYTKKTTVSAALFIAYCTGNIIGPQLFFEREAPRYQSGFIAIIVCFGITTLTIICMRQTLVRRNKRRNAAQGMTIDPETKEGEVSMDDHLVRTGLDETDFVNGNFRYYL